MPSKFQSRKKFPQKLVFSFSFFSLLLAACSPSVQPVSSSSTLGVNQTSLAQETGADYTKAVTAIDPHVTEKNYVNTNYKKYLDQALTNLNQTTSTSKASLSLTSPAVISEAKKLVQPEAADYAHFKYIADRSVSLNWTNLKPGSLFFDGSYGTGWIVDRFKNPDGSWSNDFLVSTNIHVINTIFSGEAGSGIGKTGDYAGFPNDAYELAINNQVYDPQNSEHNWMYPSSYAKLPNWNPKNYFLPKRRALLNQIKNKYQVDPYYSLAFSGQHWNWGDFDDDINSIAQYYVQHGAYQAPSAKNTHWYDSWKLASHLFNQISTVRRYYNQLFFDPTNISGASEKLWKSFYGMYENQLDFQSIFDAANSTPNRMKTLDNGYLRVTIPDDVLAAKLPVFLDPSKYNQWTFPKFAQHDVFKNYSFNNYQQPYGFLIGQSATYKLAPEQQEPIWHGGYPAEQTWNGLSYLSPGPILKTSRGMVTDAIFQDPSSKKNLDHNECQIYNDLCNGDAVSPAAYSLGSRGSNTGGGSSGSMALNKDYEVQGIYWGEQHVPSSLLKYVSTGLYEPMYSSSKLDLPMFESLPDLTSENNGAVTYLHAANDPSEDKPFADLITSYLETGLKKVFVGVRTEDTYKKILNLDKLKSFDYSEDLEQQIKNVMATLTDNNPDDLSASSFTTLTSKPNGLSDVVMQDHLYTAIKTYWDSFFNEAAADKTNNYKTKFYASFNFMLHAITTIIDNLNLTYWYSPSYVSIDFTAFVKRDLGTVNMAAELKNYFEENHYQSQVYNNPNHPLTIVNERL